MVARVGDGSADNLVAIGLKGGFFDLAAIRHEDEEAQLEIALSHGAEPFKDAVPEAYRNAFVAFANASACLRS